jgi:hypothetical protein
MAGVTTQLAVLDDASLTGTGQSSADVLGNGRDARAGTDALPCAGDRAPGIARRLASAPGRPAKVNGPEAVRGPSKSGCSAID